MQFVLGAVVFAAGVVVGGSLVIAGNRSKNPTIDANK